MQTNSELASDETNYYLAYLYMIRAVRFCVRRLLGTIIFRDMEPMELSMGLPRGVELSIPMAGVGYTITYLMRYTLLILPSPQLRGNCRAGCGISALLIFFQFFKKNVFIIIFQKER